MGLAFGILAVFAGAIAFLVRVRKKYPGAIATWIISVAIYASPILLLNYSSNHWPPEVTITIGVIVIVGVLIFGFIWITDPFDWKGKALKGVSSEIMSISAEIDKLEPTDEEMAPFIRRAAQGADFEKLPEWRKKEVTTRANYLWRQEQYTRISRERHPLEAKTNDFFSKFGL